MPRLPRIDVLGVAQHVIQRGNNRQFCFASDEGLAAYATWLYEYSVKYCVEYTHRWL